MIPLIKIYDNFTSNKGVSKGLSIASTAYLLYNAIGETPWTKPFFLISLCAGCIFASMASTNLVHNESVKSDGERNSIYATLSLINTFGRLESSRQFEEIFGNCIANPLSNYGYNIWADNSLFSGLKIGFSVTILALQTLKGKTSIKFRSPFIFE
jgi:hypothetical protein